MNTCFRKILCVFALLFCTQSVPSFADCDIGPVIFRDTIYGALLGGGVGILILVANQSTSDIAPILATSALIGGGVGAVVGVVELSLSNCGFGRSGRNNTASKPRFKISPTMAFLDPEIQKVSLQNDASFPLVSSLLALQNMDKLGVGFSMSYHF